jgi:hypothetical protein
MGKYFLRHSIKLPSNSSIWDTSPGTDLGIDADVQSLVVRVVYGFRICLPVPRR